MRAMEYPTDIPGLFPWESFLNFNLTNTGLISVLTKQILNEISMMGKKLFVYHLYEIPKIK